MVENITNYFTSLNFAGQSLFIVGVLLIITFIILLIILIKPERNKTKKIYGESILVDKENLFEEKMKNIDNICDSDLNLEDVKTRNLKTIVDQLKELEGKNNGRLNEIEKYELEQENTDIISVEEFLRKTGREVKEEVEILDLEPNKIEEPSKYVSRQEVYSSVYNPTEPKNLNQNENSNNENFLNSLKEFRNNL